MSFQKEFDKAKETYKSGRYRKAVDLWSSLIESEKQEKTEPPLKIAEALSELGKAYRQIAEFEKGEQALEKACDLYVQQGEDKSLSMAMVLNERGLIASEQADIRKADEILNRALEICRSNNDGDLEESAEILNSLGLAAWRAGDDMAAFSYYQEALAMRESVLGKDHNDYAETMDNIGVVHQRCIEFSKAEICHREALAIRERCLDRNHPDLGYSIVNLAESLKHLGQTAEYESMYKRTIDIWQKSLGEKHPNVATATSNLGLYYLSCGRLNDGKECFEKALAIKKEIFGPDSSNLIITTNNLAIAHKQLGQFDKADALTDESIRLMQTHVSQYGENDVQMVITLADALRAKGKKQEAEDLLERAEKAASEEFGEVSMKVARILQYRASSIYEDEPGRAKDYYARVLKIEKEELGHKHPQVAETLRMLAACFTTEGDTTVSELLNLQARAIEYPLGIEDPEEAIFSLLMRSGEDTRGGSDSSVLQTKKMMAEMLKMQGNIEESELLYQEYLDALQEIQGESIELADEYLMKAVEATNDGDNEKAIPVFCKSLEIRENLDDSDSKDIIFTLSLLASTYETLGYAEEAIVCARRQLGLIESEHGESHWSLKEPISLIARTYEKLGNDKDAETWTAKLESMPAPTALEQTEALGWSSGFITRTIERSLGGLTALADLAGIGNQTEANTNQDRTQDQD